MKRSKFVFVIESQFPCVSGGIENWLYNIIRNIPNNVDVKVISEESTRGISPFYDISVQQAHYPSLRKNRLLSFLFRRPLRWIEILFVGNKILRVLNSVVDDPSKTFIFCLSTMAPSTAGLKYKSQNPSACVICSSRGPHAEVEAAHNKWLKNWLFGIEKNNVLNSDIFFVNGFDMADYYKNLYDRLGIVLKNGVDIHRFDIKHDTPYPIKDKKIILSVGTLIDIKGVNELIKAFALIKDTTDTVVCFLGKGNPKRYIDLAYSLKVEDKVYFLGSTQNVVPYLQNADVITCLSGGGGFAMAALEAMCSKTPIIAWDSAVYHQFNNEIKTMKLVPEKNIEMLADAIVTVLKEPDSFKQLTNNAYILAKKFDWKIVVEEMFNYCEEYDID